MNIMTWLAKKGLPLIILVMAGKDVLGQDPNYSQFFNTPIYYNPAFTGLYNGLNVRFSFRDQWPNLPVDFKSYYFSADLGDRNLPGSGGLGLIVTSDNEGIGFIHNLGIGLTVGVRIPLFSFLISQVGIKANLVQKSVNWDDFVFSDQLDERYGINNNSGTDFVRPDRSKRIYPDFAAGGLLQFTSEDQKVTLTTGFAMDHIFEPDVSFLSTGESKIPRKIVIQAEAIITTNRSISGNTYSKGWYDPVKLNPGIIYQHQGISQSLTLGMNLVKYNLYLGAWFRSSVSKQASNALILMAGYRFFFTEHANIKFFYSYDLQIGGNLQETGGAHEISLILEFRELQVFGSTNRSYYRKNGKKFRNPREACEF
ncbi:MAG: type IX secretion system membrane protein PorP/SprF [Bacteroidetes bacterium]|nr:MAG: type IX secretion system membrane protein PorP/SprF [Bacteroidota bacterium]